MDIENDVNDTFDQLQHRYNGYLYSNLQQNGLFGGSDVKTLNSDDLTNKIEYQILDENAFGRNNDEIYQNFVDHISD
jgi:hypothetical protein